MQRTEVLVPLKAFSEAKSRLQPLLPPQDRATLAKNMAARVIAAARTTPVTVVSSAPCVVRWAGDCGVDHIDLPHSNLNQAIQKAVDYKAYLGVDRIIVAHADLPRAESFDDFAQVDGTVVVTDRAGRGTKVLSIPTRPGFTFRYGRLSAAAHYREAVDRNSPVTVVHDELLSLDINTLDDLAQLRSEAPYTYEQLMGGCMSIGQINQTLDQRTREHHAR